MDRTPGRYNLHKLGWKQFEDLVIEINRTILGATVTPFRVGPDGGRDGFFKGQLEGEYSKLAPKAKSVTFQCKHTSSAEEGITPSLVSDEIPKVRVLAAAGDADLFIIFTNRRLGGANEQTIRSDFEAIPGVQRCCVFGEEWIESHIDGNYKLLRRVPRLFGIGDLSQIFSKGFSEQTQRLLDMMKGELATFVPTDSYRKAVEAMEDHGMVVLVGAAASGKTSIALNLCSTFCAEDKDLEVIKIDSADQFIQSWSARDHKKLFWIEDFLGETTLDDQRAKPWSRELMKLRTAWKDRNKFIFTSRDYVLKEAGSTLRAKTIEFFENCEVIVSVDDLSSEERRRILYNHIKLGDLTSDQKRALKTHLPMIADLPGFTPELARRLGSERFHKSLAYTPDALRKFIEQPVHFFTEVIHDLSVKQRAAIVQLLFSSNNLKDPITSVPVAIERAYGVTVADICQALTDLQGSLTKTSEIGGYTVWQVHHPSMIDAMHHLLRDVETMRALFVEAAPLDVVLRDCSTTKESHRVFVSKSLYPALFSRVLAAQPLDAASFLIRQNTEFLAHVMEVDPGALASIMGSAYEVQGEHLGIRLLMELEEKLAFRFEEGRRVLAQTASTAFWRDGCAEVLWIEDFENPLGVEAARSVVLDYHDMHERLYTRLMKKTQVGFSSRYEVEEFSDFYESFYDQLSAIAEKVISSDEYNEFSARIEKNVQYGRGEIEEHLKMHRYEDDWYERRSERSQVSSYTGPDYGIFSDVDE
jgi:hypothetical protein